MPKQMKGAKPRPYCYYLTLVRAARHRKPLAQWVEDNFRYATSEHAWITKEYIINDKLVPFFGDMRMCDVRPIDVIRWQNELTEHRDADGKP